MTTIHSTAQQLEHSCNLSSRGESGSVVEGLTSGQTSSPFSTYSYYKLPRAFDESLTILRARNRRGRGLGKHSQVEVPAPVAPVVAPVSQPQVNPLDLSRLAPGIQQLNRLRLEFGNEMKRQHGRSRRERERLAEITEKIDAEMRVFGGPFRYSYVRKVAIQIINPHHRWGSGVTKDPNAPRMTPSDCGHLIPRYECTYGADVLMTPAFASLIEAAKEFLDHETAAAPLLGRPNLMSLVAKWGFATKFVALAAWRLLTMTGGPKPKRKTGSIKKNDD